VIDNTTQHQESLPTGWEEVPFTEVADLLRGVSYKKSDAAEAPRDGYLPILRATNIQNDSLILESDLVYVPDRYVKPDQRLKVGDVVVCMSSGSKHLVGKTAQLWREWEGAFGAFCAAVRFAPQLDQRFAGYFFGSTRYRSLIRERSSGVNINNLRRGDIESLRLPIPPLSEQKRIADQIETQFTRLDAAVAALQRAQATLQRYKASVLKAACEGRLLSEETVGAIRESPDYEPADQLLARILAERRQRWEEEYPNKRYKELTAPDVDDLPEVPKGWCWTNMASITVDGPQNGLYLPQSLYGQGIPILRIDDYQDGWSRAASELRLVDTSKEQVEKYNLAIRDLVINRVNSPSHLGKCLVVSTRNVPSLFESNMMRLRLSKFVSTRFIEFYLRSPFGRRQLTKNAKWAVNQASINQKDVGSTSVALPPLAEQQRIVEEVECRLSVVSSLEAAVQANLRRAERLRQSILKRAFEGRLVAQDPNDEPAVVLLEQIRAEREDKDVESDNGRQEEKAPQQLKLL
jgi:type I restriction enzyme S subunit